MGSEAITYDALSQVNQIIELEAARPRKIMIEVKVKDIDLNCPTIAEETKYPHAYNIDELLNNSDTSFARLLGSSIPQTSEKILRRHFYKYGPPSPVVALPIEPPATVKTDLTGNFTLTKHEYGSNFWYPSVNTTIKTSSSSSPPTEGRGFGGVDHDNVETGISSFYPHESDPDPCNPPKTDAAKKKKPEQPEKAENKKNEKCPPGCVEQETKNTSGKEFNKEKTSGTCDEQRTSSTIPSKQPELSGENGAAKQEGRQNTHQPTDGTSVNGQNGSENGHSKTTNGQKDQTKYREPCPGELPVFQEPPPEQTKPLDPCPPSPRQPEQPKEVNPCPAEQPPLPPEPCPEKHILPPLPPPVQPCPETPPKAPIPETPPPTMPRCSNCPTCEQEIPKDRIGIVRQKGIDIKSSRSKQYNESTHVLHGPSGGGQLRDPRTHGHRCQIYGYRLNNQGHDSGHRNLESSYCAPKQNQYSNRSSKSHPKGIETVANDGSTQSSWGTPTVTIDRDGTDIIRVTLNRENNRNGSQLHHETKQDRLVPDVQNISFDCNDSIFNNDEDYEYQIQSKTSGGYVMHMDAQGNICYNTELQQKCSHCMGAKSESEEAYDTLMFKDKGEDSLNDECSWNNIEQVARDNDNSNAKRDLEALKFLKEVNLRETIPAQVNDNEQLMTLENHSRHTHPRNSILGFHSKNTSEDLVLKEPLPNITDEIQTQDLSLPSLNKRKIPGIIRFGDWVRRMILPDFNQWTMRE